MLKGKRDDPVWINKNADLARSKDAYRTLEMTGKGERDGDLRALERAWKEAGDCFGSKIGESSWANKWGKSAKSSRWLKD